MGSGCTGWRPNEARSAVALSIWGPWTELGNSCVDERKELTYRSQSTYVLPVAGKKDAFIYMGDRWTPDNAIDGRYFGFLLNLKITVLLFTGMMNGNSAVSEVSFG